MQVLNAREEGTEPNAPCASKNFISTPYECGNDAKLHLVTFSYIVSSVQSQATSIFS